MLGSRTVLGISLCVFAGCYSEDRPLNDFFPGGAGGTSNAQAGESTADAGEAAAGSGAIAGQGGSQTAGTTSSAGSNSSGTAGTGNGGSATSSGGTTGGGSGGDAGDASAGQAAGANTPVGALCNSSDGAGCDTDQFCIDAVNDECHPSLESTCAGFCAEPAPRAGLLTTCASGVCPEGFSCVTDPVAPERSFCTGTKECDASNPCGEGFICGADGLCAPDRVACTGNVLCPVNSPPCSPGYTHSIIDDCLGPCVPLESCACANDDDCVDRATSCDRVAGRCVVPKAPEPRCALPYESGDCLAAFPTFAFVDGSCQPQTYGGCGGNDNRFFTIEECRARCEGGPNPNGCPEGSTLTTLCLGCGPVDECTHLQTLCAETCDPNVECTSPILDCFEDGVCRAVCG